MFVLLLAMTSLGYAAKELRQDSQDRDKTRSPPATALHPLCAFLLYSLIDAEQRVVSLRSTSVCV